MAAAGLSPTDEILVSASTNIATALAAFHNRCVPVPVDSEPETWNLNLDLIEGLITPRTKAIIPVHLFGHPVDMDRLMKIAEAHDLLVIEDCAESHGATCRGRMTGSFGDMGCFSFYANKVITTGEGGMVVTNDDSLAERLRSLRNLAFTEPRFRHEEPGFNFRMTGYQAAMGLAQTKKIERIVERKRTVAALYDEALDGIDGIRRPTEAEWARNVYWMYAVRVTSDAPVTRDQLAAALAGESIGTRTFFCPMNQQPFLREQEGFRDVACPVADELWESGMYLPSSLSLDRHTVEGIAAAIREALSGSSGHR